MSLLHKAIEYRTKYAGSFNALGHRFSPVMRRNLIEGLSGALAGGYAGHLKSHDSGFFGLREDNRLQNIISGAGIGTLASMGAGSLVRSRLAKIEEEKVRSILGKGIQKLRGNPSYKPRSYYEELFKDHPDALQKADTHFRQAISAIQRKRDRLQGLITPTQKELLDLDLQRASGQRVTLPLSRGDGYDLKKFLDPRVGRIDGKFMGIR
jgi:hypothetical protein